MEKLEKIFLVTVVLGAMGIVVFWVAGFKGFFNISFGAFIFAGVMAWIGVISKVLLWLRRRRLGY